MEYVLTGLARIQATKFEEASAAGGLLDQLEAHRDYLPSQPGFRGMNLTRSANPEGDVQVVVETRWASNNAMADYSSQEPNIAAIINANQDVLVPGSAQVLRMQSEAQEYQDAPNKTYDRLAGALLWPVGILAFSALVVFFLSRIYLTLSDLNGDESTWATVLAVGIPILILIIAWYFASHPGAPRWQWAGTAIVILGILAIAGTGAAIYDNQNEEVKAPPTPPPPVQSPGAGSSTPAPAGAPVIDTGDNFFADASGAKNESAKFSAKPGETITINNQGQAIHNVHVAATGTFSGSACSATGPDPCSKPAAITGGTSGTLVLNLAPGTYKFRCDFHTAEMNAEIEIIQ